MTKLKKFIHHDYANNKCKHKKEWRFFFSDSKLQVFIAYCFKCDGVRYIEMTKPSYSFLDQYQPLKGFGDINMHRIYFGMVGHMPSDPLIKVDTS